MKLHKLIGYAFLILVVLMCIVTLATIFSDPGINYSTAQEDPLNEELNTTQTHPILAASKH